MEKLGENSCQILLIFGAQLHVATGENVNNHHNFGK